MGPYLGQFRDPAGVALPDTVFGQEAVVLPRRRTRIGPGHGFESVVQVKGGRVVGSLTAFSTVSIQGQASIRTLWVRLWTGAL